MVAEPLASAMVRMVVVPINADTGDIDVKIVSLVVVVIPDCPANCY